MSRLNVNRDRCTLCGACVEECPYGALEVVEGDLRVNERCVLCGACLDACPEGALSIASEQAPAQKPDLDSYRGVWVFGERHGGELHRVAFELIGAGARLAAQRGCALEVLALGERLSAIPGQLAGYPVDRVRLVEDAGLARPVADRYAAVIADLVERERPEIVLAGATSFGRAVMPRVAVLVHTGLTADCTALELDAESGDLLQTRPAFGGNIMATIACRNHRPQMATVRPGVMAAPAPRGTKIPPVSRLGPPQQHLECGVDLISVVEGTDDVANIAEADVLVAGGRAVGGPEGFAILRELAAELGGQVAASRVAVDAGWIPYAHQVGQTGRTVQPSLYIACGISGSVQHRVGMQSSSTIVAINTDPDAPIFGIADYGIVGDYREVVPQLIREIRDYRAGNDARH